MGSAQRNPSIFAVCMMGIAALNPSYEASDDAARALGYA